jgi:GT2 family glycosyltransferase
MSNRPLFSILHPSARPDAWRKVYDDWMSKCVDPSQVEYVLVADERWGFNRYDETLRFCPNFRQGQFDNLVWNRARRCYVDAVNTAAKAATGQILIVIADDQFACEEWDRELLSAPRGISMSVEHEANNKREFVVEVSTGTPDEHNRGIFVMPIVSRARYERLGYLFYPEYESMYADNDLCSHARQDGVVIDARHLMFPHKHPLFSKEPMEWDAAYIAQNRREAFEFGRKLFAERTGNGFQRHPTPSDVEKWLAPPPQKFIAICMPGESFSSDWVGALWEIRNACAARGFVPLLFRQYTSNVYITRKTLAQMVLLDDRKPELVLWIDDDNVATREQFEALLDSLESKPDADVMAGWCWIHNEQTNVFYPSAGVFSPDGANWQPFQSDFVQGTSITGAECTGFPFLLMKREALVKAGGPDAFLPILTSKTATGVMGEDMAWCKRALAAGVNLYVDPKVKVMHMKERSPEPFIPPKQLMKITHEPRIAAMLRVKNEARWIRKVILSIKPLCNAGIFVMDDGSTDGTRLICEFAGAHVMSSPFAGQPLDEARDKNHLMTHVVGAANPDWILCIDGDEELAAGGVEKLQEILRDTSHETVSLKIEYLWNSADQWRTDGVYGQMYRHSIFRPRPEFQFKSFYAITGCQTHSGLHVSNAPYQQSMMDKGGLKLDDVVLLHYGYMHAEDRLRKYEWYNSIDPNNEKEDCYRHMVQGDLPEVPADAELKYAGPLELMPVSSPVVSISRRRPELSDPIRLNLGCSDRMSDGFLNVDICEPCDVKTDLREAWPWKDSSVEEIRAWDIIEHLPSAIHTMNEAFRVLKPGGRFDIIVPTTDGRGAFQDPTHVSFWNRNSFFYFEAGNPHLHRFEKAYGMKCAFRVASSSEETLPDGVTKLHIVLEAAKEPAMVNAAD